MKKTFWGFLALVVAFASFVAWGLISASTHGPPAVGANSSWLAQLSSVETLAVICGIGLLGATAFSAYQLLVGRSPHATPSSLLFALLSILNTFVSAIVVLRGLVPVPHFKNSRMCAV